MRGPAEREEEQQLLGVIISCPGSMATSKYLEAQIKNYFNFYVVDTMTTRQVEASKGCFDQVDFVISTVPIQDCVLPVAVVSPLITVEDINKIQNLAFKQKKTVLPDARSDFRCSQKSIRSMIQGTGGKSNIWTVNSSRFWRMPSM